MRNSKSYGAICLCKMFSEKIWGVNCTTNSNNKEKLITLVLSSVKRLPGSWRLQRTNRHFSHRSHLIILLT